MWKWYMVEPYFEGDKDLALDERGLTNKSQNSKGFAMV